MDVVLDDPYTIRAADANSNVENITDEVIKRLRNNIYPLVVKQTPSRNAGTLLRFGRGPEVGFERLFPYPR